MHPIGSESRFASSERPVLLEKRATDLPWRVGLPFRDAVGMSATPSYIATTEDARANVFLAIRLKEYSPRRVLRSRTLGHPQELSSGWFAQSRKMTFDNVLADNGADNEYRCG